MKARWKRSCKLSSLPSTLVFSFWPRPL